MDEIDCNLEIISDNDSFNCFGFDDETRTIGSYSNNDRYCPKDVIIPNKIDNIPVEIIGKNAFSAKRITSVIIPNTIKIIEDNAFYWNELTEVAIPSSVLEIGDSAFACNYITEPNILGSPSISEGAFTHKDDCVG